MGLRRVAKAAAIRVAATLVTLGSLAPLHAFEADVAPLVQKHCIACHTGTILAPLDLAGLGYDLAEPATFAAWARVYERLDNGEMPPVGVLMPEPDELATALASMKESLLEANLAARNGQRTPLRRLTRLEYAYTIGDLLGLDEAQGMDLIQNLPAEADTGGFDTVAAKQGISALHVRSYLEAADRALDAGTCAGSPDRRRHGVTSNTPSPAI